MIESVRSIVFSNVAVICVYLTSAGYKVLGETRVLVVLPRLLFIVNFAVKYSLSKKSRQPQMENAQTILDI